MSTDLLSENGLPRSTKFPRQFVEVSKVTPPVATKLNDFKKVDRKINTSRVH